MTNIQQLAEQLNSKVAKTRKYSITRQDHINRLPEDAQVYANEDGVVAYKHTITVGGKQYPALLAFKGRSNKPCIRNYYRSEEDRKQAFGRLIEGARVQNLRKEENKMMMNRPSELKEGDIIYTSWGYEQTNVDFYQVVKTIGKRTVEVQKIASELDYDSNLHSMSGYVTPKKDVFVDEKVSRHVVRNGTWISFNSFISGWKWDGEKKYCSWYA